jgi:hypothetical protein
MRRENIIMVRARYNLQSMNGKKINPRTAGWRRK